MSRAPYLLPNVRQGYRYGDQKLVDALVHDGLWCAFECCRWATQRSKSPRSARSRARSKNRFSVQSHRRAAAAWENASFANEVVARDRRQWAKARTVSRDEAFAPTRRSNHSVS